MRRQSSSLVMATNQTSGIGVLFTSKYNGMVQMPDFQRAITIKFQITIFQAVSTKNFCLLYLGWTLPRS